MKLTIVTMLMSILAICVTATTATNDAITTTAATTTVTAIETEANIVEDNMEEEQYKTNLRSSNGGERQDRRELNQCASLGSWCFLSWHCCDTCSSFTCCNKQAGDYCNPTSDTCCGGRSCKHVGTDHDQLMWRCL